jgi:hypothetical protein
VLPWRAILKLVCLALLAELAATVGLAWFFGARTLAHWVNCATAVALLVGLLGLPLMGPQSFARGHELEADTRHAARGPEALDNRARGVLLVACAASWLVLAIAADQALR